jgi:hypothetical protein
MSLVQSLSRKGYKGTLCVFSKEIEAFNVSLGTSKQPKLQRKPLELPTGEGRGLPKTSLGGDA